MDKNAFKKKRCITLYSVRYTNIFFISFVFFVIITIGSVLYKKLTAFNYQADLDKTVLTMDGTKISLRDLGYYIAEVEAFTQQQAILYSPDDPLEYWNLYFSARDNSTFVSDYARETAISNCFCDIIYENEAIMCGLTLSEEDERAALTAAENFYISLSDSQRAAVGIDMDLILSIQRRKLLASHYVTKLLHDDHDLAVRLEDMIADQAYLSDPVALLGGTGLYFRNNILPKHKSSYNRKILRKLPLGRITVNNPALK